MINECAYKGLRSWPGSKPWFLLFICPSGLLKVKCAQGPCPWPLPGGFEWRCLQRQQPFASFHRAFQEEKYLKSILSCDLSWTQAVSGTQSQRRVERGKALPLQQVHPFLHQSLLETSLVCVPSSTVQTRDLWASPQSPICWDNWKRWVIIIVVSTWRLQEVSLRTL